MERKRIIRYSVSPSAFGYLLIAATERGICTVALGDNPAALINDLARRFGDTILDQAGGLPGGWMNILLGYLNGERKNLDLPLDVAATPFQQEVWNALRAIPYGTTQTYQQVAQRIGRPDATRAVAQACANNPVALIVPCHRVVRTDGTSGGYRWGIERKRALIAHEAAHIELCAS
ncbi:methylated-DNA--[protein]-cysteine S-methyltransferase [Roseiflexus castenholzii]|jgi:O-6-methylguanine DNA methyltransferase|uniref:methylated-DNA--[protein]-cysteine S-methyltransferase n=1 Tax=Roseiflexus castenholzii (strain DSM 13941 / HLO8) TaxID=383372 RepID=A7NIW3_ROSCS|nr:methylated-DNA--[protein]-cysteine S-methyltransferase [Roseiflexus castenholzii]ABU57421.1 methylated-DNA--protein-cysteine methyltransferase [Roseiflexus castenholzii DSM 13941]